MKRLVLLIAIAAASAPALAEDAAHRADRLRTEQLNRTAAAVVDRRMRRNADGQASYRDAQADYARRMADWRGRVAACERGDRSACAGR